jgi:hypothetical protein
MTLLDAYYFPKRSLARPCSKSLPISPRNFQIGRSTHKLIGKERPFCMDHDEACWEQNRRAHFVWQNNFSAASGPTAAWWQGVACALPFASSTNLRAY